MREAIRLSGEELARPAADAGGGGPGQSEWSRVRALDAQEIILTVSGFPPGRRYLMPGKVDELGLTVLNLTDPNLPDPVRDGLADTARRHPDYFDKARRGVTFQLNRHTRLAPDGLFLDGRRVGELDPLFEHVDRNSIAEISVFHRAFKRGAAWGALVGAGIGVAAVMGACGTNWNQETTSCGNLTPLLILVAPVWGAGVGTAVGAAFEVSSIVYRAPPTVSRPAPRQE